MPDCDLAWEESVEDVKSTLDAGGAFLLLDVRTPDEPAMREGAKEKEYRV